MKSKKLWVLTISLLAVFAFPSFSQKAKTEVVKHDREVRDIIAFLQYMLNTLGDGSTSAADKDIVITQSFSKVFRDSKVQIEDDLVEGRKVVTNKDVQAYLKDVDFFFRHVAFDLSIDNIHEVSSNTERVVYRVAIKRNLKGTSLEGKPINKTIPRFIEINYSLKDKDLKIVSIYSNEFNEDAALRSWWSELSYEWQRIFKRRFNLADSIGIEHLREIMSVDSLDISHNAYIQTLEPLSQLLELKVLKLNHTAIRDISPLRHMTQLRALDISYTPVSDLTPLRYVESLQELNIQHAAVTEFDVIEKLSNLKTLVASNTRVRDFEAIKALTKLESVDLSRTSLSSLEVLSTAMQLKHLMINNTGVYDLSPLRPMSNLRSIYADSTFINDISVMSNFSKVNVISLNYTRVNTLTPLLKLTALEKIYCDETGVDEAMANAFMNMHPKALVIFGSKELRSWWNELPTAWKTVFMQITHLAGDPSKDELARIVNVDSININGNKFIRDLEPLRKFSKLKTLHAAGTSISTLQPLAENRSLLKVDISGTSVENIDILRIMRSLKRVAINHTNNIDISVLRSLGSLERLYADDAGVTDDQVRNFLETNQRCLVIYKSDSLTTWWSGLSSSWKEEFKQHIEDTEITTESLHALTQRETLQVSGVASADLNTLNHFVRLKKLTLSASDVRDLSPITRHRALTNLHVHDNPIRQLEPLRELTNLTELVLSNTPVTDLASLASLSRLERLNVSGTPVKKITPLSSLASLQYLDCSNTAVSSLKPVMDLPLTVLKASNTKIPTKEIERFRKKNPECTVTYYR